MARRYRRDRMTRSVLFFEDEDRISGVFVVGGIRREER